MDNNPSENCRWDAFISHASEDKADVALPLAEELRKYGLRIWLDKFSLKVGDSLREKIDEGLAESRYGVVILSPAFVSKNWPQKELNGLFAKEVGGVGSILPVWHRMTHADILRHSPMIADKVAVSTSEGIRAVALALVNVIRPEAFLAQTSIADTHVAADRLREQLKGKNPSLDYRITVGPKTGTTETRGPTIATCCNDELRIDVLAADPEAYRKNPISFEVKMTKDAWERFQAGLREGETVILGPEEIRGVSSGLFEVAGFAPGALTDVQSFSVSTPEHLLAGKLHFRLTFRQGSDVEQFPYVEFEKTRVGSDLLEIRSCAPPIPIKLILGLRSSIPSRFNVTFQFSGHDVRRVCQAFRAVRALREGGALELYDLDSDKPLGTLRCDPNANPKTDRDEMLELFIEALHDIAIRLRKKMVWPPEFTEEDFSNALWLAAAVRTGTVHYPPSVLTLTMPEVEAPVIEKAVRDGNVVRLNTTQAPPFSSLFGQQIDLGPHQLMFMAADVERISTGVDEEGHPTVTARLPLLKPMLFFFEALWPRPIAAPGTILDSGCVVFDTNAYRDYCHKILPGSALKMEAIRTYESSRQIRALANPFVIMELAAHLTDDQDPDYANCRCALNALVEHCATDDASQLRLVADSESLLAQFLLGQELPTHRQTTEVLAKLAMRVHSFGTDQLDAEAISVCSEIKRQLADREDQFVQDMRQVVLMLNSTCTDWNPFAADPTGREQALAAVRTPDAVLALASAFVIKVHLLAGVSIPENELRPMSEAVLERFRPSLTMYLRTMEHIIMTGSDMSKPQRANTVWDMQILMGIGQPFADSPGDLMLITADTAVKRAADAASADQYVLQLQEYLAALTCKIPAPGSTQQPPSSNSDAGD
jgi:hypothetical protein